MEAYSKEFRLSSHSLAVETGRYRGVPFRNSFCFLCKDDIEDEFHFILKCPPYETLRKTHIKPFYRNRPSVLNLLCYSHLKILEMCVILGNFYGKQWN